MNSFKNRWKIIEEEIINKSGKRIYVETKIKNIIEDRYAHGGINTNSSYIYQKMDKLVDRKIYIPLWNMGHYAHHQGYINIFELHKKLDYIIRKYHLPKKNSSFYTSEEKKYMNSLLFLGQIEDIV